MSRNLLRTAAVVGILGWGAPTYAVQPDEMLPNARMEQRARDLSSGLRCMVCQNQSIDDSDAPLARDLRMLVRERIVAGDSDEEVTDYLVSRYGEFVLLRPRLRWDTALLWGTPILLLAIGALVLRGTRRSAIRQPSAPDLSAAEEARLARIVGEGQAGNDGR